MNMTPTLPQLGWKPFFQQQLTLEKLTEFTIGRVIEQHRSSIVVMAEQGQVTYLSAKQRAQRTKRLNSARHIRFHQHPKQFIKAFNKI